jgi:ribosomal protein L7/L12/nitrate reductase NapE component
MLSSADKDKINEFLRKGKKLEAVKYLRDQHPLSLKDASDWVSFLAGESLQPPSFSRNEHLNSTNSAVDQKVKWLLQKGDYLEAINYVREEKTLSLKEAKHYVDRFSRETGITIPSSSSWKSGSIGMLIFLVVGTVFLIISIYLGLRDYSFYQNSIKVEGQVVELHYATVSDTNSGAVPVVEYVWQGKTRRAYGDTYSNPPAVEIGETIEVLISQQDNSQVKLNIISERYFLVIVFGIMGIVFFAIGFVGKYGWPKW